MRSNPEITLKVGPKPKSGFNFIKFSNSVIFLVKLFLSQYLFTPISLLFCWFFEFWSKNFSKIYCTLIAVSLQFIAVWMQFINCNQTAIQTSAKHCTLVAVYKLQPNCSETTIKLQSNCKQTASKLQANCKQAASKLQTKCNQTASKMKANCTHTASKMQINYKKIQSTCNRFHLETVWFISKCKSFFGWNQN